MCCRAYERDYYMEVAKRLPKVGTRVVTAYGEATVTGIDIFAQAVVVEDDNSNEMRLTLDQISKPGKSTLRPKGARPGGEDKDDDNDG
jgi:cell fate regulator YaaT (PSP1 superfamily)